MVEHGEDDAIIRGLVMVSRFVPERRTTADRLKNALQDHAPDPDFADDVEAVRVDLWASFTNEIRSWPDT